MQNSKLIHITNWIGISQINKILKNKIKELKILMT